MQLPDDFSRELLFTVFYFNFPDLNKFNGGVNAMVMNNMIKKLTFLIVLLCLYLFLNTLIGIGDGNNDGCLEIGGIYRNSTTGQYEFRFYKANTGENFTNSATVLNSRYLQGNILNHSPIDKLLADLERVYLQIHEENKTFVEPTKQSTGNKTSKSDVDSSGGVFSLQGLGAPCTDVVTADLDGDHRAEFLFGIGNSLQCISLQGLKWSVNTGGVPGEIALADVNRDGKLEIIVCTNDGYLKVYR
jgi:hypothetical protein